MHPPNDQISWNEPPKHIVNDLLTQTFRSTKEYNYEHNSVWKQASFRIHKPSEFLVIPNLGSSYIQQLPDKNVYLLTAFSNTKIFGHLFIQRTLNQLRCPTKKNASLNIKNVQYVWKPTSLKIQQTLSSNSYYFFFSSELHFVLTKCTDTTNHTIQDFFPKHFLVGKHTNIAGPVVAT